MRLLPEIVARRSDRARLSARSGKQLRRVRTWEMKNIAEIWYRLSRRSFSLYVLWILKDEPKMQFGTKIRVGGRSFGRINRSAHLAI